MAEELLERIADGRTDLGAGARLDARDAHGDTPLFWESWYARPDAILRKLSFGGHRIHPDRKPVAISLLGWPRGTSTPERGAL